MERWGVESARAARQYLGMSESLEPVSSPEKKAQSMLSHVRREPGKSLASAFLVGLILSVFPVGRIISALASIALTLVRPALMVFGAFKAWEEVERRRKEAKGSAWRSQGAP